MGSLEILQVGSTCFPADIRRTIACLMLPAPTRTETYFLAIILNKVFNKLRIAEINIASILLVQLGNLRQLFIIQSKIEHI